MKSKNSTYKFTGKLYNFCCTSLFDDYISICFPSGFTTLASTLRITVQMVRFFSWYGNKIQLPMQEFLLRSGWKGYIEEVGNICKQAVFWMSECHNHICCKLPPGFRKSAGKFISKSQNFSFQTKIY